MEKEGGERGGGGVKLGGVDKCQGREKVEIKKTCKSETERVIVPLTRGHLTL